jgi:transitional endoplasmic reticulum ATPase
MAVWKRYLGEANSDIDVDRLVAVTELFTPADIEFAARKGAQVAFDREMKHGRGEPATTEDYLMAIGDVRPTLTAAILAEFSQDKALFARLSPCMDQYSARTVSMVSASAGLLSSR